MPIANGTEPMEAVIAIDVLRRAGADVTVASVENQLRVDACHGVKIVADTLVSDCSDVVFDLIALPVPISLSFYLYTRTEMLCVSYMHRDSAFSFYCWRFLICE